MRLVDDETPFGPWQPVGLTELTQQLLRAGQRRPGPVLVAVDGRGGSGKSTLASALADVVPGATVVHSDDVAWHEPLFGWGHLLDQHILTPLAAGLSVSFQPPAWPEHGREGRIEVAADCPLVLVEGTGAAAGEVERHYAATVWVQSDFDEAERRGLARDVAEGLNGDEAETLAFWHYWMDAELAHFRTDRPWERAGLVVCGTPVEPVAAGTLLLSRRTPLA
ncbi:MULTISPECIES: uridine kinase family protein [unclassified Luteococcus]|uniref:uridine kinase family protein n=1 Tax=unclassified Luteococcus TaxID=2639923 RepID=UPI00313EE64C